MYLTFKIAWVSQQVCSSPRLCFLSLWIYLQDGCNNIVILPMTFHLPFLFFCRHVTFTAVTQARGQDALRADNIVPPNLFGQVLQSYPAYYPSHIGSASGPYALLAFGEVPASHPEHPDTFLPLYMARQASLLRSAERSGKPVRLSQTGRTQEVTQKPSLLTGTLK